MKFYKTILTNKQEIVLDEADFQKLLQGLDCGSFVRLKKAIINPSFIVAILPIPQQEALEAEMPPRQVDGYIDDERGVFVATKDDAPVVTELSDQFKVSP